MIIHIQFKECIQLLKAAGDGDLLIVEKLVTMKYIDVNTTDEVIHDV